MSRAVQRERSAGFRPGSWVDDNRFAPGRRTALRSTVCLLASLLGAHAHGPFDSSARITVGNELLEISVSLGPDVARQFFADHLPGSPLPQPVGRGLELPVAVATNLFELSTPEATLVPEELRVLTDGLEYAFVATVCPPAAGPLKFRANYFALHERVAPGLLEVLTEDRRRLSSEILSRSTFVAEITLPARPNQSAFGGKAPSGAVTQTAPSIAHTNQGGKNSPAAGMRSNVIFGIASVLAALILGRWLIIRNRPKRV